ncbi:MAG: GNAT family N-acetyltransferase [Crocinitomicaceae bacterium]|nr:GNAT family N-acetyltransferase [Crocinitomicaceae bacterium]
MISSPSIIRPATKLDVGDVLKLIRELAMYENAPQEVSNTEQQLTEDLFGNNPVCESIVAVHKNQVVGFALFYTAYSTWKGKCLYLEDLYVQENFRRAGIGKKLFDYILQLAKTRNMKRLSWQVLDWNEPAIEFYKKYHAELDPEWINGKIRLDQ